jgi:hypothetical protein
MNLIWVVVLSLLLVACGDRPKTYTVGVINAVSSLDITELKLPTSRVNIEDVEYRGALTSYSKRQISCGKQAARLADQIFQGVKPADLPVETAEFYLAITLKAAEAIGPDISNEVLLQADIIIR